MPEHPKPTVDTPQAGIDLNRLAYPTPFLVMDAGAIIERYHDFAAQLPGVHIHYAMKCNPDPTVLRLLHAAGSRFEIASLGELEQLVSLGVDPGGVLFSNPVKKWEHIRRTYLAGVRRFSFDSMAEADKLAQHAPGAQVLVRLKTPPAGSAVPSEGKYGVDFAQAVQLMAYAAGQGLQPYGVAFHVGSQMEQPDAWSDAIAQAGQLLRVLAERGIFLQMIDMGGGFPAHYDGAVVPPLQEFAWEIRRAVQEHLPPSIELAIEPGRGLTADAGIMVSTVIGLAERGGARWAHLDIGAFNGMMEALETANQLRFPMHDSRASAERARYHVTGPSCDSQDTILYDVELSGDLRIGDRVYIGAAGAYTTAYASRFNGFDVPAVYVVNQPDSL